MFEKRYHAPVQEVWTGRVDSTTDYDAFRWHQWIESLDLRNVAVLPDGKLGFAILGFCCDEGVRRNKGRQGAAQGPQAIRTELAKLPCAFSPEVKLFDAGDISCDDGDLAASQAALAEAVAYIRRAGLFPIVLGGGHEVALGHYRGHAQFLQEHGPQETIGIINFDAHFDLRPVDKEGSSGTMFRQIANEARQRDTAFHYLCLGIQRSGNTLELFQAADALGATYCLAQEIAAKTRQAEEKIKTFIAGNEHIYLTVCADVFSSAIVPGVSAPQPCGLWGHDVISYIQRIIGTGKVVGFDIAEIAPPLAPGNAAASLAREVIFAVVVAVCEVRGLAR